MVGVDLVAGVVWVGFMETFEGRDDELDEQLWELLEDPEDETPAEALEEELDDELLDMGRSFF